VVIHFLFIFNTVFKAEKMHSGSKFWAWVSSHTAQRKMKPVSGSPLLKLVTCACFSKAVFLLVMCLLFDRIWFRGL